MASLGGTVTTETDQDNRHRLRVELPLPREPQPGESASPQDAGGRGSPVDTELIQSLLVVTFCAMTAGTMLHLLYLTKEFRRIALSIGYLAALLALQLSCFSRPTTRLRSVQSYGLLFV